MRLTVPAGWGLGPELATLPRIELLLPKLKALETKQIRLVVLLLGLGFSFKACLKTKGRSGL